MVFVCLRFGWTLLITSSLLCPLPLLLLIFMERQWMETSMIWPTQINLSTSMTKVLDIKHNAIQAVRNRETYADSYYACINTDVQIFSLFLSHSMSLSLSLSHTLRQRHTYTNTHTQILWRPLNIKGLCLRLKHTRINSHTCPHTNRNK